MTDDCKGVVLGWLPQPIGGMLVMQQGFFDSFFAFVAHDSTDRKAFVGYVYVGSGYIASGRNEIIKKFLTTTGEWLLMCDWDISFTPDCVYALLDAADPLERPIISGCYVTYFGDGNRLRPCWMLRSDVGEFTPAWEVELGKVVECTTVGMGFTLIHRSALELIGKAYKDEPWHWFGHDIIGDERVGEDLTFCSRARAVGCSVWGHGGVLLGHTKAKTLLVGDIAAEGMATPHGTPSTVRGMRVLNVGGGSKAIPIPARYTGWEHVLLDIEPLPDVDVVMDARDLIPQTGDGVLRGYDVDGVLTAGVEPIEPYVIITGRIHGSGLEAWKERALSVHHRPEDTPEDLWWDNAHAGAFKAGVIAELGVTEFYEDHPIQMEQIRLGAPDCVVRAVPNTLASQYDAVLCAHNLEHFSAEDVPTVLAGFRRVLKPGGFVEIHVPDGDEIQRLIDDIGLDGVAYESPAGPITPNDMLHGHQASIAAGMPYMAHHVTFDETTLRAALSDAGFENIEITAHDLELEAHALSPA